MEKPQYSEFAENIHTKFRVVRDVEESLELELVGVTDPTRKGPYEHFALEFRGPKQPILAQQTYALEHDRMGDISIFLVPIRGDENAVYYEAIFNRLLKT
ncbi:MAG: hypothetical protein LAO21_21920 [Acidobacteriia bacterium]|nr:hypothetical protein [Terriglobia bacterium]